MEICCLSFKSLDAVSQTDSEGMLFDGKAPRLTALFLTGCGLDWHFNNYVNLQYLDIHKTPVMFSAKTVIEDLSNTPHLKKLTLRQCFYPYGETFSSTAHLPKLEELTIESELASCVQLMEHLTYPKHLLLAIICTESTNEIVGAAQHGLMDSLAQTLGEKWKAKEHPILRIEIHPDFSGFVFRGRTDIEDLKRSPLHLNIVAKFEHDTQYFLGAILRHLNPLEGLKFLEISNMRIADKDWVDLDASAGQLEAICIDKANVPGFLRGFSQGCKGVEQLPETLGQIQATPLPLFQTLDALKLSRVHFAEETGDGTSTVFDNLHRCLISRKAMGCELPELSIHSCYYVTETQIQQLSSAVGRVRGAYYDHDHHRWHFL
ncbi:hypothetical protein DXG01_014616 [Tephrocybe rancida]|nr:hypothetical protein DXG01_014616 [Tephrocybe rancida]